MDLPTSSNCTGQQCQQIKTTQADPEIDQRQPVQNQQIKQPER